MLRADSNGDLSIVGSLARAEFENETGDSIKDAETRLLAGFDHYIVTAAHAQAHPVMQRYGAYCVIAKDLT